MAPPLVLSCRGTARAPPVSPLPLSSALLQRRCPPLLMVLVVAPLTPFSSSARSHRQLSGGCVAAVRHHRSGAAGCRLLPVWLLCLRRCGAVGEGVLLPGAGCCGWVDGWAAGGRQPAAYPLCSPLPSFPLADPVPRYRPCLRRSPCAAALFDGLKAGHGADRHAPCPLLLSTTMFLLLISLPFVLQPSSMASS